MTTTERLGIDDVLRAFGSDNQGTLRLEAGMPARILGIDGATRDLSSRPLTRQEILSLVSPVVPEHARRLLPKEPSVTFDYPSSVGAFTLTMTRDAERLVVLAVAAGAACGGAQVADPPAADPPLAAAGPATPVTPVLTATDGPPIDRLFRLMTAMGASDLHLSVGMPPLVRKDGQIRPIEEGAAALDVTAMQELLRPITPEKNAGEFACAARHRLRLRDPRAGPLPRQPVRRSQRPGCGVPSHSGQDPDRRATEPVAAHPRSSVISPRGWCSSPGRPGQASRRRWPRWSITSTAIATTTSSPSRIRSSSCTRTGKCLVNQREVHTHTESFKGALRAALREDPDIILVGEMRDLETVAIAIETAETGHLVFGTLHTTTAASTVDRIIEQFPSDRQAQIRVMLSESLRGVICQTLCRKIGGGRIAALEVLIVTSAVSNLIREGKTFQIPSMMQVGKAVGMMSLNDALMELVTQQLVAPEEAYAKSVDKTGLEGLYKRAGIEIKMPGWRIALASTLADAACQPEPRAQRALGEGWRRGRDSNPWKPFGLNGFQDRRLKPLGHLSPTNDSIANRRRLAIVNPGRSCTPTFTRSGRSRAGTDATPAAIR